MPGVISPDTITDSSGREISSEPRSEAPQARLARGETHAKQDPLGWGEPPGCPNRVTADLCCSIGNIRRPMSNISRLIDLLLPATRQRALPLSQRQSMPATSGHRQPNPIGEFEPVSHGLGHPRHAPSGRPACVLQGRRQTHRLGNGPPLVPATPDAQGDPGGRSRARPRRRPVLCPCRRSDLAGRGGQPEQAGQR